MDEKHNRYTNEQNAWKFFLMISIPLIIRSLFFFAKSYVHNDLAAEDIASEALIKLWEKLKAESVEEKYILPLLLTILKNKALDYLKHEEVKRSAF